MNIRKQRILFTSRATFWKRYKVKIASTIFAIFIWFLIVTGDTFDYYTSIPIETDTIYENYIITNSLPMGGRIHLRGDGMTLLGFLLFKDGNLKLEHDWAPGAQKIFPTEKNVDLRGASRKLTVIDLVEPKEIDLEIEELVTQDIPVLNQVKIGTVKGYTIVGDIKIIPDIIRIRGPKSALDTLQNIFTASDKWENLKFPIDKEIEVHPPRDIKIVDIIPKKVSIIADIQKLMEKRISRVPVSIINLPPGMRAIVIPSHLALTVDGGVNKVGPLEDTDIIAFIDYGKLQHSQEQDFPAYIKPIPDIRFRDIEPQRFKMVLERE